MNGQSRRGLLDRLPSAWTLLVSTFAGLAGVAGSFAVAAFTPSFVAGPIAGLMARKMPAVVVRYAITVLGDLGDQLNVLAALTLSTALFAGAALVGLAAARRAEIPLSGPPVAAAIATAVAFAVTRAPLASLAAGAAVGAVLGVAELSTLPDVEAVSSDRRRVLGGVASGVGLAGVGYLLGNRGGFSEPTGADEPCR